MRCAQKARWDEHCQGLVPATESPHCHHCSTNSNISFFKGLVPATEPPHCHHWYTNSNISFFKGLVPAMEPPHCHHCSAIPTQTFKGLVPATEPPHCHHCYTNSNISFFNPLCPWLPTLFPLFITDFLICIPGSLHMGFHSKRAAAGLGPSGLRAWFWQQSHLTAIIATPSSNISFFPFVNPFNPPHTRTHILCRQCPWAE